MIGAIPPNCICYRKPTSVTYSSVFIINLSSVHCIDDLRADDNSVWIHGGKPRKEYTVEFDPDTSEVINTVPEWTKPVHFSVDLPSLSIHSYFSQKSFV